MINEELRADLLSDDASRLAERVGASVVAVRGTRFGGGCGVVWQENGLIVTNHHVVPNDHAEIGLAGNVRLRAHVALRSEHLDLAALEIEGKRPSHGLSPATIRDSSNLRVGELVVAVGNPLGERNAVTLGVVGGLGAVGAPGRREVIRAAIKLRPGNSGGALADAQGRVVGIPHMVAGPGLALVVPSHVVDRFLLSERVGRAYFGLAGQWVRLPARLVDEYGLPGRTGVLVQAVSRGSPAARANLAIGDVVVGVTPAAGEESTGPIDLLDALENLRVGEPARLTVIRSGQLRWVEATPRAA